MKKLLITLIAFLIPLGASAQLTVTQGGTGLNTSSPYTFIMGNNPLRLIASSSPTAGWFTATDTTATSTFPNLHILTNLFKLGNSGCAEWSGGYLTATGISCGTGSGFSTTSSNYWASQGLGFSTTSATYFVHSSTTIPKLYSSNTFTNNNTFNAQVNIANDTALEFAGGGGGNASQVKTGSDGSWLWDTGGNENFRVDLGDASGSNFFDFTNSSFANSVIKFYSDGQVLVTGSTSLRNFTGINATTTNATSTNLYVTNTVRGAGLTSCSGSSDKLIWNSSTGQFGCGADAGAGGGITALYAQYSNAQTGSSQVFATSTDTNVTLTIGSSGDTHTFTPGWTGTLAASRGGTSISNPSAASVLVGSYAGGGWQQIATSSLGLKTTNVAEGTNLYYTDARVLTYLDTLPKGYYYSTTSQDYYNSQYRDWQVNSFGALVPTSTRGVYMTASSTIQNLNTINGTTTNATTTNLTISSLTSELLKVDGNGKVLEAVADTDYQVPLTFGDGLTRTANDIDFDGGATPSGDLGGTWASPSVTDDSHAHTGATLSGIDVSADTNLTAGTGITLTNDDLSIDTSQNIATLSNLTSNGFVKTSGGNGTLSVDTNTYLTGNQTITLSGVVSGSGATSITTSYSGVDPRAWNVVGGALTPTTTTYGILVNNASSTITNLDSINSTSTNATSTTLYVSGQTRLASLTGLLKASTGVVTTAVSGTDYSNFGSSVGPTELQSTDFGDFTCNGTTCSLDTTYALASRNINTTYPLQGGGNLTSDRTFSLAFGTTTDNTWSGANMFTNATNTIVNLTTSLGTTTHSTSTSLFATTASTSVLYGAGLADCDTGASSKLLWDATTGKFSCGTDQTGGGASFGQSWEIANGALSPTTTLGIGVYASSTIGAGTRATGLTISGGATTTGPAVFQEGIYDNYGYILSSDALPTIELFETDSGESGTLVMSGGNLQINAGTQSDDYIRFMDDIELNGVSIVGSLLPLTGDSFNLGSELTPWAGIYLGPDECINMGFPGDSRCLLGESVPASPASADTLVFYDPNEYSSGRLGISTSTPKWSLNIASSTRSQLTLSDGSTGHISFRNINNNFYLATSSPTTFATSTKNIFSISSNGTPAFPYLASCNTIDTDSSGNLTCGTDEGGTGATFGQAWEIVSGTYLAATSSWPILINNATSTVTNLQVVNGTTTNATTTNLTISSLTSELLKVDGSGKVLEAVSGTDYSNFGASVGPTELASADFGDFTCNGTICTLDATYLTTVDISANTNLTAGDNLTLTNDDIDLDATLTNMTAATFSGLVTAGNFLAIGSSTLQNFTGINSTTSNATSTNLYVSGQTRLASLNGILKGSTGVVGTAANGTDYTLITATTCSGSDKVSAISADGTVTCSADQTGVGGASFGQAWEMAGSNTYLAPTTSVPILVNNSTSTITNLTTVNSTSTSATTTNLAITSLTSELLKVNASGLVQEAVADTDYQVPLTFGDGLTRTANDIDVDTVQNIAKLSNLTSNGFVKTSGGDGTLSVDTNTYLTGNQTITLSGVISGSGATSITTAYSGVDPRGWNVVNGALTPTTTTYGILVNNASSTIRALDMVNSTSTNATSTNLSISGQLDVDTLTSALTLTGASGIFAEYAGTSCTNQFVRSLSALGVATCATVGTADVAGLDVSDDLNLTAGTNITLTGDDLSVDDVFILNTGDTGTGIYDFGGATSFEIPNGGPTVDTTGEIGVDTTSDQFLYFGASTKRVIQPFDNLGFAYATTSWAGTTTLRIGPAPAAITVQHAYCETNTGTVGVSLYDGTNRALYMPTASTTINKFNYTASNNSFTAGETMRVDIGTPASSPTQLSCRFMYTYDAD
jgi:hypothetical protein